MIKQVHTIEEFNEVTKGTVVVDFFATWCGPCRMLAPVLEQIDEENLIGVDIIEVDVDEVGDAARKYGVQSIPTLIVFKDGHAVDSSLGYKPLEDVVSFVKNSIE